MMVAGIDDLRREPELSVRGSDQSEVGTDFVVAGDFDRLARRKEFGGCVCRSSGGNAFVEAPADLLVAGARCEAQTDLAFDEFVVWVAHLAARNSRRKRPVCERRLRATSSGVPSATMVPPPSPPSGPRSMSQSASAIRSRLCSMTMTECPASTNR